MIKMMTMMMTMKKKKKEKTRPRKRKRRGVIYILINPFIDKKKKVAIVYAPRA
jgi:hypothetical protein